jgi:hypothetical protein
MSKAKPYPESGPSASFAVGLGAAWDFLAFASLFAPPGPGPAAFRDAAARPAARAPLPRPRVARAPRRAAGRVGPASPPRGAAASRR